MKKILASAIVATIAMAMLIAAPRYHLGLSLNYDVDTLSQRTIDDHFLNQNLDESTYNGGAISQIHGIGPKIDFSFFPFGVDIPVGFGISSTTLLNIGYTETGGSVEGYFSYNQDLRQDLTLSLCFQRAFGTTWGLFADTGLTYSWYRYATTNRSNDKTDHEYNRFSVWGISANLGAYLEYRNSYFKVGATLFYNLQDMDQFSFRYGLTAGGGVYLD